METCGAKLKKIRLEKGISLEEVHKKTRIHLDLLKAIEEDSLINLNPVYIKGFLKIYCNFLRVDPAECMPDYKTSGNIVTPVLPSARLQKPLLGRLADKLSFISSLNFKTIFKIVLIIIFIIGLFKLGKFISWRRALLKQKTNAVTAVNKKSPLPTKPLKSEIGIIRLAIRARDNCWVQLKCDGKMLFQGILRKGRTENWEAKERIEFSLGNAAAVDLEINGKIIPSLGARKGQALKNISITKEGLSIAK